MLSRLALSGRSASRRMLARQSQCLMRRSLSTLPTVCSGMKTSELRSRFPAQALLEQKSSRNFSNINRHYTDPPFEKILIANRGEIACRVMKTAKKMGVKTVAIYSEADARSVHVQMADEAYCVGPAPSAESYLRIDKIIEACKATGAQAVHPGYGFLSENEAFCDELEKHDITFIGPKVPAIKAMGDKIASKQIARDANVNTIPGFLGTVENDEDVIKISNEIGYPVMIKASAGGGGKGMRIAYNDEEACDGFRLSKQEAISSFGDDRIFIEKFIEDPRHIEIQVLVDSFGKGVYLNERECSIQRRNQKVIEEAPSVFITPEVRKAMGEQALALAASCDYQSAGTVEFLVDKHQQFYFLEMNTRLQVEHPITEYITGVDLVEQMLNIAAGRPLLFNQDEIGVNGWAFESRVYAENPFMGFLPSIGFLERYIEPEGHNIRCDSGIQEGSEISIHYDPLICKLVTYGKDRQEALSLMERALDEYVIRGVTNNIPFLRALCGHERFVKGELTTGFIEEEYPDGFNGHELTEADDQVLVASGALVYLERLQTQLSLNNKMANFDEDEYLHNKLNEMIVSIGEDKAYVCRLVFDEDDTEANLHYARMVDGKLQEEQVVAVAGDYSNADVVFNTHIESETYTLQTVAVSDESSTYKLKYKGSDYDVKVQSSEEMLLQQYMPVKEKVDTSKQILSPMPGVVFAMHVKVGDTVVPGQEVCVVEAMKMQNALRAVSGGVVKAVNYNATDLVAAEEVLVEFE